MNAYTSSAVAILMLAVMGGDLSAAEPQQEPAPTAGRTAENPRPPLGIGRLFDRLLGKTETRSPSLASADTSDGSDEQSDGQQPDDAVGEDRAETASSLSSPRRTSAATTPEIDLESPRIRLPERGSTAVIRAPVITSREIVPPDQEAIELDESVATSRTANSRMPDDASSGTAPVKISIRPQTEPDSIRNNSMPSSAMKRTAPVITARPVPAAVPSPAPLTTASTTVAQPRRLSTSAFLADDVRFGPVVRRTPSTPPLRVEESAIEPEVPRPAIAAQTIDRSRLHVMPPPLAPPTLAAEDFAAREPLRPASAASAGLGQSDIAEAVVSPSASPGQLLQAVHYYGTPGTAASLVPVALSTSSLPAPTLAPMPAVSPPDSMPAGPIQEAPAQEPTLADPPPEAPLASIQATPPAISGANGQNRRAVRGKVLHGQVSRLHASGSYALVEFQEGAPAAGSRASVYRRQLFQRKHLGDVEIFVNPAGELCARPEGRLKLNELAIEDELIVLPQIISGDTDPQAMESAPQL